MMGRFGWAPTADGAVILENGADKLSQNIPLIVGYTRGELSTSAFDPSVDNLSMEDVKNKLAKMYPGDRGAALLAQYQKEYPNGTPAFLYSVVTSMLFANGSIGQVEDRAAQKDAAPVYAYRFDWCPDIFDGRLGAFHSLEIGFTFDNTDRWDTATGGGERARDLASLMSQAWINFARSGDPNHRGLAVWPAFSSSGRSVMLFNDVCEARRGPDDVAHQMLSHKPS